MDIDTKLGHYKIISAIGKGGMGEVFLAQDTKLGRKVALKILPFEFAADSDRMNRFVREAQSASALNHPNIITIHEIGESAGTHFIATEFIDGKTLNDYVKDNSLNYKSALEIVIQVASALDEAHQAGIVHRDIKPDNIMIRANGLVKILDFGIAKLAAPTETGEEAATAIQSNTQAGMIIGTPNYMSPEQARGQHVNHQTDIFSFGVVFYEMLSGKQPFAGDTVSDVIAAVLTKEPPRPANVPPELADILDKTLQKYKRNRHQTAKDLLTDLQEAKDELNIQSRLKRTSSPNAEEPQTQILKAATTAEENQQSTIENLKSVAVLPFTNISADEDNEYFCDGLAEELLNALSKIEDLKVAARTSAFSFKGKNTNVSEIGEKLSVKNVLEGSVRRAGNKLRISVQLINAANGFQLWSERYDREMKDIFDIQDEIALAVVDALKLKLFGDEKDALLKKGTENKEAYDLYLKARFFFNKFTEAGLEKALELYEQAIAIDENYALAYVGISEIYFYQSIPDVPLAKFSPKEAVPKITAAAERAIQIDENLAEAWELLAHIKEKTCDFQGAKEAYRRSFALDANHPITHSSYGIFLSALGGHHEAVKEIMLAQELDPFSALLNSTPLICLYYARRYEESIRHWERVTELELIFPAAGSFGGLAYLQTKRYQEAIKIFRQAVENSNRSNTALVCLGHALAISGETVEANEILKELLVLSKTRYVSAYGIALIYVGLGEKDKAIESLFAAYEEKNLEIVFLNVEPRFDPLRADPRFQDLLRRIGFPTDEKNKTDESLEAKTAMLSEPPAVTGGSTQTSQESKKITTSNDNLQPSATAGGSNLSAEPKSKYLLIGLLTLLLSVGGFFGYKYFAPTNKQINSIAVLPFENKSSDADTDYLSDGLAESLIYRLSQLPDLKVSPTSSVFRYKGKSTDPQIIAKELGVDSVLTGRIVQRGDNLTISVNLVDTRNGKSLWGEQYERKMSELLQTQREIAAEITNNLKLKLSGESEQKLAKRYTDNNEAYQLYLKGNYHYARRTKADILKGIEYFEQAIKLDPNFALAYVGVADSYNSIVKNADLSPKEVTPQAKAAAQKALEIDSTLADAHAAFADVLAIEWNWTEAEKEFKKAIELDPNVAYTHVAYGTSYLLPMGRAGEAVTELKRSVELEPLSLINNAVLVSCYLYARQNDKALEHAKKTYDLDPNFRFGQQWLGQSYIANGQYAEATTFIEKVLQTSPFAQDNLPIAGQAYAKSNRPREAEQTIEKLKELAKTQTVRHYWIAAIYAALGDKDKAFAELEKAYQERDWFLPRLKVDPIFDSLRDDPRFKDLLKRMNLPE